MLQHVWSEHLIICMHACIFQQSNATYKRMHASCINHLYSAKELNAQRNNEWSCISEAERSTSSWGMKGKIFGPKQVAKGWLCVPRSSELTSASFTIETKNNNDIKCNSIRYFNHQFVIRFHLNSAANTKQYYLPNKISHACESRVNKTTVYALICLLEHFFQLVYPNEPFLP
jgi:hypothetical protein